MNADGREANTARLADRSAAPSDIDHRVELGSDQARSRRRLISRFAAWLEAALAAEPPLDGVPDDLLDALDDDPDELLAREAGPGGAAADRYAVQSALMVVGQEAKLHGRGLQSLREELSTCSERLEASLQSNDEVVAAARRLTDETVAEREQRQRELASDARRDARRESLELLVDLRQRLVRGVEAARAQCARARTEMGRSPGLVGRWLRGDQRQALEALLDATTALEQGAVLGLERIDETLARWGVGTIDCQGQIFDPHRMAAVDVVWTADHPDGTVLGVERPGYLWDGSLLRPAEVRVARRSPVPVDGASVAEKESEGEHGKR